MALTERKECDAHCFPRTAPNAANTVHDKLIIKAALTAVSLPAEGPSIGTPNPGPMKVKERAMNVVSTAQKSPAYK